MRGRYWLPLLVIIILLIVVSARSSVTPQAAAPVANGLHSSHYQAPVIGPQGSVPKGAGTIQVNTNSLPVAVDGAISPDGIPDWLAYRHFIMAIAQPQTPSAEQTARRDALLSRVGLSRNDNTSFLVAIRNVRDELDLVAQERRRISADPASSSFLSASSRSALETLKSRENQILGDAQTRLENALTPDGSRRLEIHIQEYVKKRIKVYGERPPDARPNEEAHDFDHRTPRANATGVYARTIVRVCTVRFVPGDEFQLLHRRFCKRLDSLWNDHRL